MARKGPAITSKQNGQTQELHTPGYSSKMVDPTGAGDCFGATFVSLFLSGFSAEKALQYANASGALAVSHKGPMEGVIQPGADRAFYCTTGVKPINRPAFGRFFMPIANIITAWQNRPLS
ncbi:ribokinase [Serratia fonticola]|uniref:Ribokinase n=1 Tax=Serratia fonticola TaxID=47917 RepID=A0A4U9WAB0_SERFO|nr:ribokinase [Serratia fonticola]